MTDQSKKTKMSNEQFNQWCDRFEKENGCKKVTPPKGQAVVIFPGPDGKVDMIDAVERLYGIEHDKGDRIIRIRGGKIVSDEVVE
jgi:hypothetical protein